MTHKLKLAAGVLTALLIFAAFIYMPHGEQTSAESISETAAGHKILVLNYHKVDNMNISLSVLPKDFDWQMKYLHDHGYNTITPDELYKALTEGGPLPDNPVLITFDDGYRDNYKNAYPILKKYGFKATIFVVTGFVGRYPNYLTWEQAAELEENGISIESHTVTHRSLTDLTDDQLRRELAGARRDIRDHLGKESDFIAYPTGTYNLHIGQIVKDEGYKAAFTIKYGNVDLGSNIYAIEREPVFHTENTNKSFLERLQYLPVFAKCGWEKN